MNSLLRAGVVFEIILRGMIRQDDPGGIGGAGTRRRNWISGAREIVRATGGKSVVISSGALTAGEMRASEDIVNLLVVSSTLQTWRCESHHIPVGYQMLANRIDARASERSSDNQSSTSDPTRLCVPSAFLSRLNMAQASTPCYSGNETNLPWGHFKSNSYDYSHYSVGGRASCSFESPHTTPGVQTRCFSAGRKLWRRVRSKWRSREEENESRVR